jgi:hypothetical protein
MPLLVISLAGLIVMLGSTLWEFSRKRRTLGHTARWWISTAIGWSGILYAANVSIMLVRFFPVDRILLSAVLGVTLGVGILGLLRKQAKHSDGERASTGQ